MKQQVLLSPPKRATKERPFSLKFLLSVNKPKTWKEFHILLKLVILIQSLTNGYCNRPE
jgi:hypothetical protein